ncbi:phosphatidate cytidylyltransferase, mitochondrial [Microplitis demolitor]|uniref:phosphatidate cytidylyltransferase, mitochondrial n=1 Tax=Microplitis demolitor TaxID=69319 RepID=UPI00235B6A3F|nr:phosphatidate cytidylyltransferase, mitochondrial [Microplitis demolitor]
MMEKVISESFKKILQTFPHSMRFCFAYGSGVIKQTTDPKKNMLDLIFVVRNSEQWHAENLARNPTHYAQPLRFLGHKVISRFQDHWGAKIYYNTLIKSADERLIKYGVVSESALIEDLLDWNYLYLAGRLHKPIHILCPPSENSSIQTALAQNLKNAAHAALLLLPEKFSEIDFYRTIAGLSYQGDFRMIFGEDKSKIAKIVMPQLSSFQELYEPVLKLFDHCLDMPRADGTAICHQDDSPAGRIHHLYQLPRTPQKKLARFWSKGRRTQDMEDCLRAIAHDLDCSEIVQIILSDIVWRSSVSQSVKGIATAGVIKSVKYSGNKIIKMINSYQSKPKLKDLIKFKQLQESTNNFVNLNDKLVKKNVDLKLNQELKIDDEKIVLINEDKKLLSQEEKSLSQEKKLKDQELKLKEQEKKLHDQELKLRDQEKKLMKQENISMDLKIINEESKFKKNN